nr:hypothetical protein [Thermoflavifilum aggregans]
MATRLEGLVAATRASCAARSSLGRSDIGVFTGPGHRQLMRIPY